MTDIPSPHNLDAPQAPAAPTDISEVLRDFHEAIDSARLVIPGSNPEEDFQITGRHAYDVLTRDPSLGSDEERMATLMGQMAEVGQAVTAREELRKGIDPQLAYDLQTFLRTMGFLPFQHEDGTIFYQAQAVKGQRSNGSTQYDTFVASLRMPTDTVEGAIEVVPTVSAKSK